MEPDSNDHDERARRIVIIGAGPGGICAAIKLREAGFDDLVILEKSAGVGGTWWNNTYPGLSCDVASHLYSFSFAPKLDWTRPFAEQPEIQAYMEQVVTDHDLWPLIRLETAATGATWDEERSVWSVITTVGETFEAEFVVSSMGMFNELNRPEIDGLDSFAGKMFHSGAWNHDHDLRGRRVAVIGSAASAVQFVPEIAPVVEQLHVFQRSAQWVLPKQDEPYDREKVEYFSSHPEVVARRRQEIFDRMDPGLTFSDPEMRRLTEEAWESHVAVVEDPVVRAKLTPTTPYGCQRPLISNVYYPTYNRPNVELVTEPIERVTAEGILTADGLEREVDTIVLATGYRTTRYLSALDVTGREGRTIADAWRGGAEAYLGITTTGFPNLFMLYGPNTNNGSILFMIECQVEYVVRHLQRLTRQRLAWMDVRPEAQAAYNQWLQAEMETVDVWHGGCNQYYRSPDGRIVTQWPGGMGDYRKVTAEPDDDAYETALLARA